jgi:glucokinase
MGSVQEVINTWAKCVQQAAQHTTISKIGLAMPGPFDYEKGICFIQDQSKYAQLYGLNVKHLLADALGVNTITIYIHNDAACFLQGEVTGGSVRGYNTVVGVTLGTGLGSAIYKNKTAHSADLWKMPFLEGIAEDYLSGRWFLQRFTALTGNTIHGVKELTEQAVESGLVKGIFEDFGANLAAFLNRFIGDTNSEAVVIGGNIAQAFPLFSRALLKGVHSQHPNVFIAPGILGEQAALIGAVSFFIVA